MKVYLAGLHLGGSGYPNAARTIALLRNQPDIEIVECGDWLPEDVHLWRLARGPRGRSLVLLITLAWGNFASLIRVLGACSRRPGLVYVPYPSLFFFWMLSWVPRQWRPFCIADAYISVWDSMFRDRSDVGSDGFLSRFVRGGEGRALRAAGCVLVDTQANQAAMVADFKLDPARVRSLPLAISEQPFLSLSLPALKEAGSAIRVLFVGTLIPLHGVPTLLEAMRLLSTDSRLEFRIVGDGQLGGAVEKFMSEHKSVRLVWVREWCSLEKMAEEISGADICLGVFGGEQKAARVLPFKLYMYLAAGRAVISQGLLSVPDGVPLPPMEAVKPADAATLAQAIRKLADDPALRLRLARDARAYFVDWLSNARVLAVWRRLVSLRAKA